MQNGQAEPPSYRSRPICQPSAIVATVTVKATVSCVRLAPHYLRYREGNKESTSVCSLSVQSIVQCPQTTRRCTCVRKTDESDLVPNGRELLHACED